MISRDDALPGTEALLNKRLFIAADNGDCVEILASIHEGSAVNTHNSAGTFSSALMYAARKGHVPAIQCLLENHAQIEAQDKYGCTALMYAACNGHAPAIQCLLENNAQIEAIDNGGDTALLIAADKGHVPAIQCLLEHHAQIEAQSEGGYTALMLAALSGRVPAIQCLLEHHALIEAENEYGDTALMVAAEQEHVPAYKYLLKYAATLGLHTKMVLNALNLTIDTNNDSVIDFISIHSPRLFLDDQLGLLPELDVDPNRFQQIRESLSARVYLARGYSDLVNGNSLFRISVKQSIKENPEVVGADIQYWLNDTVSEKIKGLSEEQVLELIKIVLLSVSPSKSEARRNMALQIGEALYNYAIQSSLDTLTVEEQDIAKNQLNLCLLLILASGKIGRSTSMLYYAMQTKLNWMSNSNDFKGLPERPFIDVLAKQYPKQLLSCLEDLQEFYLSFIDPSEFEVEFDPCLWLKAETLNILRRQNHHPTPGLFSTNSLEKRELEEDKKNVPDLEKNKRLCVDKLSALR